MPTGIPHTLSRTSLLSAPLLPGALLASGFLASALLAGCGGSSGGSRPSALTSHDDAALWYMVAELMPYTGGLASSQTRIMLDDPQRWLDQADAEGFTACDTGRVAVSVDYAQPQDLPWPNPGNFDVFSSTASRCVLEEGLQTYTLQGHAEVGVVEGTPLGNRNGTLLLRVGRAGAPFIAEQQDETRRNRGTSTGVLYRHVNGGSAVEYLSLETTFTITHLTQGEEINSRWRLTGTSGNDLAKATYNANDQLVSLTGRQSVTSRLQNESCPLRGHTDVELALIRDGAGNISGGETLLQSGNRSAQVETLGRRHFLVTVGQTTVEYNSNGSDEEQERYQALQDALITCFPIG